ncbi:MAG: cellulase family glycosylhydrolase [Calditrichaeota bacterium]|nr:cellulase family glycosylhydrolase [Calditrichota bacterium]
MNLKQAKIIFLIFFIFALIQSSLVCSLVSAEEYLWAGANQYQLWFQRLGRIQQQLNAMQEANLSVLRIFLGHRAQYLSWEDPPEAYTFEDPVGTFHDENLEKVDYLMSECQKRGIRLIIALSVHSKPYLDKYGPVNIYSSAASISDHKNRFSHFLNHYNSYLGKAWKDCDEVVYAWEIQNEAGIPLLDVTGLSSQERHDMIRNFLSELASHLKQIDPNTKVSLGIAGYANYYHQGKSGDDIRTLGNIPDADIYTLHFYGGNLSKWIDDNLSYCRSINKLLFVEEFGDTRSAGMSELKNLYSSVCNICRERGIPWMFWRLGHRKDENTYSVNSDDAVWQDVIVPEAQQILQTVTSDNWGIHPATAVEACGEVEQDFQISCFPNPFNRAIQFNVKNSSGIEKIDIFNLTGQLIFSKKIPIRQGDFQFIWGAKDSSGSEIPSGVYFAIFTRSNQKQLTRKILFIK